MNIITGKDVVPEYLMYDAKPEKIADGILNLLNSEKARMLQRSGFDETISKLSQKHCVEEAAYVINKELIKRVDDKNSGVEE